MLPNILAPITIREVTLRNRIVMPPMGMHFASSEHEVTEQLIAYYRRRAEGGAGLIIVECSAVDQGGITDLHQPCIYDDRFVPGFKRLADAVHQHGAKIGLQIHHGGRRARPDCTGGPIVAPSAIPDPGIAVVPQALAIPEIERLVVAFGEGARRAREAGFDMVEIHGAHGYIVNEFLSPWYNRRTDAYGGTLEKRLRFALEVTQCVRAAVGPAFPLSFRFNGEELGAAGMTLGETMVMAPRLVAAGVDVLHVSISTTTHPFGVVEAPAAMDHGFNVYAAAAIKRVVSVPVIAVGRINDPRLADEIVGSGHADLVAMGRAFLADPDFPVKAAKGRGAEIRKCFACLECLAPDRRCSTNPELAREMAFDLTPVASPKTVWVIGGGVAGLEAATLAARRGHRVTLYERGTRLGGQILIAAVPPHKAEILNAVVCRLPLLEKYGVDVLVGTEVTAEMVRDGKPDVVILATGSRPVLPDIPGIHRPEVVQARDVLAGKAFVGPKLAILGGGMVGVETAAYLADHSREVTIVELMDAVAGDMPKVPRAYLMERLRRFEVRIITGARVVAITEEGLLVKRQGGHQLIDGFHSIVLALGNSSCGELAEAVRGLVGELYVVGDAAEPGRIMAATAQAADLALRI